MLFKEVNDMIASIGLPYAYYAFPDGTAQEPPFVVFYYAFSDDVYADNENFKHISNLTVELYTENKDFEKEDAVEAVLSSYGITWAKTEAVIESEHMIQVTYTTEVHIEPQLTEELTNAEN